jgi:hypothetical protein
VTATNHAVTGALIATLIKQPLAAVPIAFASHFVLDALPHFGIHEEDIFKRNHSWQFKTILITDLVLASLVGITLLIVLASEVSFWVLTACMFAAVSPDLIWGVRFFREIKTKIYKPPKDLFSRLHLGIQWSQTPSGVITEVLWFICIFSVVFLRR